MSDLNQAISDHATGSYTVTRRAAATYDENGRLLPAGTPQTLTIVASVQPASPEEIADLPEGQTTSDAKLILTATMLRTRGKNPDVEPDVVTIKGREYRVDKVEEIEHWGETHYEVIATKIDDI